MSSPRQTGCALSRHQIALAILGLLLFIAAHASGACFPPILVINSSAYAGAAITGSNAWEYNDTADSGVLVLDGSGNVYWGPNTSNLTVTGTWDGGLTVTTGTAGGAPGVQVPQVLLFFSGTTDAMTMQGYDGTNYSPLCNSAVGTSGTCYVQAFNGITGCSFYVFDFYDPITQDTSSCYRFQTGSGPVRIHAENGWPPSDVFTFPNNVYIDGQLFISSYFSEGITNPGTNNCSYWSQMYFVSASGTTSNWAEFTTTLASDSPTGDIYGNIGDSSFYDEWNPLSGAYTAEAGLGISPAPPTGPGYGPPSVDWYGDLLPFAYTDLEGDDVYLDPNTASQVIINSSGSVTASQPNSNLSGSYSAEAFSDLPGFAAVTGTGNAMHMVGLPAGVTVLSESDWYNQWFPPAPIYTTNNNGGQPPDYILNKPDGTAVFKYVTNMQPAVLFCFYEDPGPGWLFSGTDMILDMRSGNPPSNLPSNCSIPSLPPYLYADNQVPLSAEGGGDSYLNGNSFTTQWVYEEGPDLYYLDIWWNITVSGTSVTASGIFDYDDELLPIWSSGTMDQNGNFTIEPEYANHVITEGPEDYGSPVIGPPQITWDDTTLWFDFTGEDGADNYSDWSGELNVYINPDDTVVASGSDDGNPASEITVDGTYNPSTYAFDFGNSTTVQNFAAQDGNGNIEGVAPGETVPGLEMYFYESGNAGTIQLGNGTYLSPSNCQVYTWQRNDGTEGVLYSGTAIPANSPILIQDYNGNYSSPVYLYIATGSNDFTEDCTMNSWPDSWPATNLYPQVLYVNGNYSTIDMSTLSTSGSGQNQSASVSYDVQPTIDGTSNGLVTVNWSWSTAGFSGGVSGSFGAYSSFSGTWDGTWFTNLPPGLIVTTNPPPVLPTGYPPEISWNGVDLTFDPTASSVSGTNESGYDVYHDDAGLGLTAEISPTTGQVILIGANGTQYNGSYSYNSGTGAGQFTFTGTSPGNVAPVGTGFGGPPPVSGTGTEIAGDLDITGDYLTMGTWVADGDSVNALAISYADTTGTNPSQVQFSATRASIDWLWTEATSDNTEPQIPMMEVDPAHRVLVHDTTPQNVPTVILNPNGPSAFTHGLIVQPQGDIGMGTFTTGTSP